MKINLGIDIGSHTIKVIELAKDDSKVQMIAAGSTATPPKALTSNIPADLQSVGATISKLLHDIGAHSRNASVALPESQVFTRVIEIPQLTDRELASAIKWEAEQYVPLPLDQVNMDYSVLRTNKETGKNNMEVLLVASPKSLIEKYITILESAGLNPIGAETEIIAASRALVRTAQSVKTAMIVSLGAQTSDFAILNNGIIAFTRSISAGGEAISRALVQNLEFSKIQAEEYKRTYGVERDKLEGKILAAVKPIVDTIIGEIKRAINSYTEKYKERVDVILLNGGTARLPGIVMHIAEETGVEVQLGNPWLGITKEQKFDILNNEGPTFCVAVGLALR